jgi:hypothetical protein
MKVLRTPGRGLGQRLVFEEAEFDAIGLETLRKAKLLPAAPAPIRIDRLIESFFEVTIDYVDLGEGVLGATSFRPDGKVNGIAVALALDRESAGNLFRSTLAHEAGHGLLHPMLFMQDAGQGAFSVDNADPAKRRILCRARDIVPSQRRGYDGRWWEYQANRMIGSLLLPRPLVITAAEEFVEKRPLTGSMYLSEEGRMRATEQLARLFEVSQACVSIRLDEVFPQANGQAEF